jgi:hypothetical protein
MPSRMRATDCKAEITRTVVAAVAGSWLLTCYPGVATAQARASPAARETLNIGDEPGRISTEEAVISEGPYARQVVFFRSGEPPGTLVVHTSERFAGWPSPARS